MSSITFKDTAFRDAVFQSLQKQGVSVDKNAITHEDLSNIRGVCIQGAENSTPTIIPHRDLPNSWDAIGRGVNFCINNSTNGLWIEDLLLLTKIGSIAIFSPPKELNLDFLGNLHGVQALIVRNANYTRWAELCKGNKHLSSICLEKCVVQDKDLQAFRDLSLAHMEAFNKLIPKWKRQKKPFRVEIENRVYVFPLLPHLGTLNLINVGLTSVAALSGLSVRELDLSNNQISDLQALAKISGLYKLNLAYNNIRDLTPLKEHELFYLDLRHNNIEALDSFHEYQSKETLSRLFLEGNPIRDIKPAMEAFNIHPRTTDIYYFNDKS